MAEPRILIGVPAFNEGHTIRNVVWGYSQFSEVFVVNDGSNDNTLSELKKSNCKFISMSKNQGYDKTLSTIFEYFLASNYTHLITADADGEHQGESIGKAVKIILNNRHISIGVGERNKYNRNIELIFSLATFPLLGVIDPLSGLKIYSRDFLKSFFYKNIDLEVGTKPLIFAKKINVKPTRFSIVVKKRKGLSRVGNSYSLTVRLIKIFFILIKCQFKK